MIVDMDQFEGFCFPTFDGATPGSARQSLATALEELGHSVPLIEMSDETLQGLPATLLLGWQYDYDASVYLFAVEVSKISASLRAAFEHADGSAWAFDELMYGDDDARAFMLIDVATMEDADDTLESIEEEVPGFTDGLEDVVRGWLGEFEVARFQNGEEPVYQEGAFDRRFVAAHFVRRCM